MEDEFWCELVLNGVGGRSIEEAKECLLTREVEIWRAYVAKNGSLNPSARADWNAGLLASLYANANRAKNAAPFKVTDFIRYHVEQPLSLEQARERWS